MAEQIIHTGEHIDLVISDGEALDTVFVQEPDSTLCIHLFRIARDEQALNLRDTLHVRQTGTGCRTEIYALFLLRGNDNAALHTRMCHEKGQGTSAQTVKFILADHAQGEFFGEMTIAQDAQKVEAEQTNRNLLLSDTALMRTRPQLEIYADDVKASHGASTGQLDESSLFYMQQRCISREEGRKLLLRAFTADVVDTVKDDRKRQELMDAIDRVI